MLWNRSYGALLFFASIGYFAFYILFTGVVQVDSVPGYTFSGISVKGVDIQSEAYNGPGVQVLLGSAIATLRTLPLVLSVSLSLLFGVNIALFTYLYKGKGLKSCFYGGFGGLGAIIPNFASFSYLCCGWAASLILVGSTFLASISMAIASGATILLTINAYILWKRTLVLG